LTVISSAGGDHRVEYNSQLLPASHFSPLPAPSLTFSNPGYHHPGPFKFGASDPVLCDEELDTSLSEAYRAPNLSCKQFSEHRASEDSNYFDDFLEVSSKFLLTDGPDCPRDISSLIDIDDGRSNSDSSNGSSQSISDIIGSRPINSITFSRLDIKKDGLPFPLALPSTRFSCDTCLLVFDRKCDMNKHNRKHLRSFKCTIAGCPFQDRGFATSKDLKQHLDTITHRSSSSPKSSNSCPRCPRKFTRKDNLLRHLRAHHS